MIGVLTAFAWLIGAFVAWALFAASAWSVEVEHLLTRPDPEEEFGPAHALEGTRGAESTNPIGIREVTP